MDVVLITDDFYPQTGGVAHTLMNLYEYMKAKKQKLIIFNPSYKNEHIYNVLNHPKSKLKDLYTALLKRKFYYYTLLSLYKIFNDKSIKLSHRIKIVLYLFTKPKILVKTIDNVERLYPYLKKENFNVIVSSNSGSLLVLNLILSRLFRKKTISLAHGNDFLVRDPFSLKTIYFRYIDLFILNCNTIKKLILRIHNLEKNKLIVINRAVSMKKSIISKSRLELRKKFNIPNDEFIILSVGRQNKRKNFQLVIRALKKIVDSRPELKIKYYLIGHGKEATNLKNLTKKLGLEAYIVFLTNIDNEKRNEYYTISNLFVLPSKVRPNATEGFGIVFLEANLYKIPVIGTKTGGIVDAIIDGETGFLIRSNDLEELVIKILNLIDNEDLRIKMGEFGYKRVIKEFLWEDIVNDYINVFNRFN